jgi:hypothetical protein
MDGPVPGLQGRRTLTVATHPMTDPPRTVSPESRSRSPGRSRQSSMSRTLRRHGFSLLHAT